MININDNSSFWHDNSSLTGKMQIVVSFLQIESVTLHPQTLMMIL
jgi:hypothetical protein